MKGMDAEEDGTFSVLKTRQPVKLCPASKETTLPSGNVKLLTLEIVCQGAAVEVPGLLSFPLGDT